MQSDERPPILIDGLNVAYWCGAPPSLRLPLSLLAHLLEHGQRTVLLFDASTRYKLIDQDRQIYDRLLELGRIVIQVRSGQDADRTILKIARDLGARIVTRDKFKDHRARFRKIIDDPDRLMGGAVANEVLHVPAIGLTVSLATSSQQALDSILDRLAR